MAQGVVELTVVHVLLPILRKLIGCQEALRSRGLRDDTTCIVVDIAPRGPEPFAPAMKKSSSLLKLLRCTSTNESHIADDLNFMEELFDENSHELAER